MKTSYYFIIFTLGCSTYCYAKHDYSCLTIERTYRDNGELLGAEMQSKNFDANIMSQIIYTSKVCAPTQDIDNLPSPSANSPNVGDTRSVSQASLGVQREWVQEFSDHGWKIKQYNTILIEPIKSPKAQTSSK